MKISALIMAGGKGSRMGLPVEKPMLDFLGNPLIDYVVEAIENAKQIADFYVVTSGNTPKTEKYCKQKGWRLLHTQAKGYHNDLKEAVLKADLRGPVLTMPSDIPAITGQALDKVVDGFEKCGKEFLAVFVPIEARQKLGLSISSTDEYKGVWYAVSGINVINGSKIQGEGKIETSAIISEEIEVLLNVNTEKDVEIAQKLMKQKRKK